MIIQPGDQGADVKSRRAACSADSQPDAVMYSTEASIMLRASTRFLFFLTAILFFNFLASAQDKLLTLDDLYDPEKRVNFSGDPPAGLTWLDDKYYLQGARKVNAMTGEAAPFFDAATIEATFIRLPGISADDAKQIVTQTGVHPQLSNDRTAVLINYANDLFYYRFGGEAVRLINTADQ